jgi:hypothetical protein
VQPTIWTGLPETAAVVRRRSSARAATSAPSTRERGGRLANATDYGLSTTIWTTNLARAHRMAARIEVGITWINSWFLRDLRTPSAAPSSRASAARAGAFAGVLHRDPQRLREALRRPMDDNKIEQYGDELYDAGVTRRTIAPLREREPDITIEDAYRIQERLCPPPGGRRDRRRQEDRRHQQAGAGLARRLSAGLRHADLGHGLQEGDTIDLAS